VVRKGETLSSIAAAHGIAVAELRRLNGLAANSSLIRVGQSLRVRPRQDAAPTPGGTHVVRWGDTLSRIATAYGVRLADLLRLNQLTPHAIIRPGQRIHIPAAR
jgi:spore germination protein